MKLSSEDAFLSDSALFVCQREVQRLEEGETEGHAGAAWRSMAQHGAAWRSYRDKEKLTRRDGQKAQERERGGKSRSDRLTARHVPAFLCSSARLVPAEGGWGYGEKRLESW